MKKLVSLLLCAALVLALCGLTGCGEKKPLKILVDLEQVIREPNPDVHLERAVDVLLADIKAETGIEDIEVEYLPNGYEKFEERKMAITRLRTEIMAGQGPDIFLVSSSQGYDQTAQELVNNAVFLMPEKSMELGLFLPLNDYLADARYMEFDKFLPQIMEAGRSERWGQVIIPLQWNVPVTLFVEGAAEHTPNTQTTWEDMLNDDTKVLQAAAELQNQYHLSVGSPSSLPLGKLADYPNKQLCFTEEDLLRLISEEFDLDDRLMAGDFDDLPTYFKREFQGKYEQTIISYGKYGEPDENGEVKGLSFEEFVADNGRVANDENLGLTMIPVYSDDGGVTATIEIFAAISANTKRPDDAFAVLDRMLSSSNLLHSDLFGYYLSTHSLPIHEDFLSSTKLTPPSWYPMNEKNFAAYCQLRESITHTRFSGTLDMEIELVFSEYWRILHGFTEGDIKDVVHRAYSRMQKEISE